MTLKSLPLGVIGTLLALAGMIGYHLAPEHLWIVTTLEGLALVDDFEMGRVRRNAAEQGGFHVRNLPCQADSVSAAVCRS